MAPQDTGAPLRALLSGCAGPPPALGSAMTHPQSRVMPGSRQGHPCDLVDVETTPARAQAVSHRGRRLRVCGTEPAFHHRWLSEHDVAADAGPRDRGNSRRNSVTVSRASPSATGWPSAGSAARTRCIPCSQGAVHAVPVTCEVTSWHYPGGARRIGDGSRPPRLPASPTNCPFAERRRWAVQA